MKKIKDAFPDLNRELKFIPLVKEKPQYLNSIEIENFNNNGYIYPINIFNENQMTKLSGEATCDFYRRSWLPE